MSDEYLLDGEAILLAAIRTQSSVESVSLDSIPLLCPNCKKIKIGTLAPKSNPSAS